MDVIKDSIETSMTMKIFNNIEDAMIAHIYKSKLVKMSLSKFKNVDNFNPERLQETATKAYLLHDRPRGKNDISSVKYYQKQIRLKNDVPPIWLVFKKINIYYLMVHIGLLQVI